MLKGIPPPCVGLGWVLKGLDAFHPEVHEVAWKKLSDWPFRLSCVEGGVLTKFSAIIACHFKILIQSEILPHSPKREAASMVRVCRVRLSAVTVICRMVYSQSVINTQWAM